MQTKRTLSAGNRALGRREDELRLRRAAERERERFHRLGNQPIEVPRLALVGDLDQPRLAKHLQMMGDGRLGEPERLELAYTSVTAARQAIHDREPSWIGERLEARGQTLELPRL